MIEDEVVREVRAAREAFAASHGYDIGAMVAALRDVGIASGRQVIRLAPRPAIAVGPDLAPRRNPPIAAVLSDSDDARAGGAAELGR